jgi:hypothetical protein
MLNELFVVIQITCINEFISAFENLFLLINKKAFVIFGRNKTMSDQRVVGNILTVLN